ncbi:MAG: NUDIX domain-containing protein [Erysipelotrichaceae bacterium]|nr:NUDIX domain-containing protein [Erysipelotrichaceae bacterium]
MHYKYCPECGLKLIDKEAGDDGFVPYCTACEKYWFDSFASCVIIMVVNEFDEIAMLSQPYLSTVHRNFVSGYISVGETAEACAMREVEEELGIKLESLVSTGTYWFSKREQLMHGFVGFAKKQDFTLSSEVEDAQWIPHQEAEKLFFPARVGSIMPLMYQDYLKMKEKNHADNH